MSVVDSKPRRTAYVGIDAKGDLAASMIEGLAHHCPAALSDVRWLDPFTSSFPFNLVRLRRNNVPRDITSQQLASLVGEVSTATGAQRHLGLGARQLDVLQHVLLGALACDHHAAANILWALDALILPRGLKLLGALTSSERARQFLATAQLGDELRVSCAARLRSALAPTDSMERLMSSPDCIQFDDLIAPGRICLIDLGRPTGGAVSLQRFFSNLLTRLVIEHLMERPSPFPEGPHVRICIDEAQVVAPVLSDLAEAVLTTGRSRNLSLTVMSQGTVLLNSASDTLVRVLFTNTNVRYIGRLAASDAELLAREQAPARGTDEKISAVRQAFVSRVTNLSDREFVLLRPGTRERFVSAEVDLAAWKRAAEERRAEIEAVKQRLALPPGMAPRVTLATAAAAKIPAPVRRKRPVESAPGARTADPVDVPAANGVATARRANGSTPRSRWG